MGEFCGSHFCGLDNLCGVILFPESLAHNFGLCSKVQFLRNLQNWPKGTLVSHFFIVGAFKIKQIFINILCDEISKKSIVSDAIVPVSVIPKLFELR